MNTINKPAEEPKRNLRQKLLAIAAAVGRLPKSGYNQHFRYNYVLESDVLQAVRDAAIKEGVVIRVDDMRLMDSRETSRGNRIVQLLVCFRIEDADSADVIDIPWFAEALDNEDKGIQKAVTSAYKYFLLKTFFVSTGDDPDGSAEQEPEPKAEPKVEPKAKKRPWTNEQLAGYLKSLGLTDEQRKEFIDFSQSSGYPWQDAAGPAKDAGVTTFVGLMAFYPDWKQPEAQEENKETA